MALTDYTIGGQIAVGCLPVPRPAIVLIAAPATETPPELAAVHAVADVVVADSAPALRDAQRRAEIALVWDFQTDLLREAGPGPLRWIHTSSIGVDAVLTPEVTRGPAVVTNTRGVFERPIAEFVLAAILFFAKDLRRINDRQRAHVWEHRTTEPLTGRRVLVLGPGPVGREITAMLRACGLHVDVVGRRAREDDGGLGHVHGLADLARLLPHADDLVLALPLTAQTRGIVDAKLLSRLRPAARIINVGRGALIDEPALIDALRSGRIAAAALDVFAVEPLPADHPYWAMDNVLVSAHMSGDVDGWARAAIDLFLDNLARFQRGEPMRNVVDKHGLTAARS